MIEVGTKVRFVPLFLAMHVSGFAKDPIPVVGTVIFANPEKEFFVVEYSIGCGILREGFQYRDIGRRCSILKSEKKVGAYG